MAKKIASYIAHPIYEYIGAFMLQLQGDTNLNIRWSGYSANTFVAKYGAIKYKNERTKAIMIMNGQNGYTGTAHSHTLFTNRA